MNAVDSKTLPTPADEVADELFEPEPALEPGFDLGLADTASFAPVPAAGPAAVETGSAAAGPAAAELPSTAALEAELRRAKSRRRFRRVLLGVLCALVVVAVAAVLYQRFSMGR